MTGDVTAEATANLLEITSGAGEDTLTTDSTSADIVVNAGAGNDTVDVGGAATGSVDGGTGTDTLDIQVLWIFLVLQQLVSRSLT